MEIKFELDEAKVMKMVIDGMGSKEIHQMIANSVIEKISDNIVRDISKGKKWIPSKTVVNNIEKDVKDIAEKHFKEKIYTITKKYLNDYAIEEHVDEYITQMLDGYFDESPIQFEFHYRGRPVFKDVMQEKGRR